jgi:hypothetical protein
MIGVNSTALSAVPLAARWSFGSIPVVLPAPAVEEDCAEEEAARTCCARLTRPAGVKAILRMGYTLSSMLLLLSAPGRCVRACPPVECVDAPRCFAGTPLAQMYECVSYTVVVREKIDQS